MLTAKRLRAVLRYDPDTGLFTWLVRPVRSSKARTDHAWNMKLAGKTAGCIKSNGYLTIGIDNVGYFAHRLAWFYMTHKWPKDQIDHKNCNRTDNRWSNLREATPTQNHANAKLCKTNSSGVKGVYWRRDTRKWCAQISHNGDTTTLGSFCDIESASAAYMAAAHQYFGDFARQR